MVGRVVNISFEAVAKAQVDQWRAIAIRRDVGLSSKKRLFFRVATRQQMMP